MKEELFWNLYKNMIGNWIIFYNDDGYELVLEDGEVYDESFYELFLQGV